MKKKQEVMNKNVAPFTIDELWQFRKELKEVFGENLDGKLKEFADDFAQDPLMIRTEYRDVAYKIFWMMKLIPIEPNQN